MKNKLINNRMMRAAMTLLLILMSNAMAWGTPIGHTDDCTGMKDGIHVQGWAYDTMSRTTSIDIRVTVYRDEKCAQLYTYQQLTANLSRPDVNQVQGITGDHGFDATIYIGLPGTYWVRITAISADGYSEETIYRPTQITVTSDKVTLISSTEDWNLFAGNVSNGRRYSGELVRLTADISVNTTADGCFKGTFDGCGHTMTVNLPDNDEGGALFNSIDDATIQRVIVEGSISNSMIAATIAVSSYGKCTIKSCHSNVAMVISSTGSSLAGALISMVEGGTVDIIDCAFTGSISSRGYGGMIGLSEGNSTVNYTGCLFSPSSLTLSNASKDYSTGKGGNLTRCYYNSVCAGVNINKYGIDASDMTGEELLAALGSGWIISNDKVVPNMSDYHLAFAAIVNQQSPFIAIYSPFNISYTVTAIDGTTLTEGTDFTATITDDSGEIVTGGITAPGTYALTIIGMSPYVGTQSKNFDVVFPNDLTYATISGLQSVYIAPSSPFYISYTVAASDGKTLTEGTDFTATITDSHGEAVTGGITHSGSYSLTVTGISPNIGTIRSNFEVMFSHDLTLATISGLQSPCIAPMAPFDISYYVTAIDGTTLTEDTDFTATITDSQGGTVTGGISTPGTYTLTIMGINPYEGTITRCFEVVFSQDLTIATISGVKSTYYWWNGQGVESPAVTVTDRGGKTVSPSYYTMTIRNSSGNVVNGILKDNGSYTLTIEAIKGNEGGYREGQTLSFSVYRCPPGLAVDSDFNEGELGYYYVNLPWGSVNTINLPDDFTSPIKVYDNAGKNAVDINNYNYSEIKLKCPEGYVCHVFGDVQLLNNAEKNIYCDYSEWMVVEVPLGGYSLYNDITIKICPPKNSYYKTFNCNVDLDVDFLRADEPHGIRFAEAFGVNAPANLPSYRYRDDVSMVLNTNVESGLSKALLGADIKIEDDYGTPIDYTWDEGTYTLTFVMPPSDVTISPMLSFRLADNASNSKTINTLDKVSDIGIMLEDRTLWKDGAWNTLCLPFDVDDFSGTPLEGATVKTLNSSSLDNGTLTMNFEDVTTIEAGRPYIVKWNADRYVIRSEEDWNNFVREVHSGDTFEGKRVVLDADISVSESVIRSFSGTFDGGGHTINLNFDDPTSALVALFYTIENATIRNLRVTGSVNGGEYSAGIVGVAFSSGGNDCLIENCWMDASVTSTHSYIGGIIGYGLTANTTKVNSCYVTGHLCAPKIGVFCGCVNGVGSVQLEKCVANGTYSDYDNIDLVLKDEGNFTIESCYKTQNIGTQGDVFTGSAAALASNLGSHWTEKNGNVVLKPICDFPAPFIENPTFKHVNINKGLAPVKTPCVDFVGTYSPVALPINDKSNLYLGADNTLYWPNGANNADGNYYVNACRAYFHINDGAAATLKRTVLNFGDEGDATGVVAMDNGQWTMDNETGAIYDLSGRRVNGQFTIDNGQFIIDNSQLAPGIYIVNGRKVVVK